MPLADVFNHKAAVVAFGEGYEVAETAGGFWVDVEVLSVARAIPIVWILLVLARARARRWQRQLVSLKCLSNKTCEDCYI